GSTEWCEAHADELSEHAALYVNSDSNGRGYFHVDGSHSLEKYVNGVAQDVTDPEKHISIWKRDRARLLTSEKSEERKSARARQDLRLSPMGSGSDYTAFIDHLGIASLNIGFSGEDDEGIYHSAYDDFYWYTHFADTDFAYGRALAQTDGRLMMRFADADVLPYDFAGFAQAAHRYATEVKDLLEQKRQEITDRNQAIADGLYDAVSDPRHPLLAPPKEAVPPFINFAPLDNALASLDTSAARYEKAVRTFLAKDTAPSSQSLAALNTRLLQAERKLISPEGLPRRSWYRHLIYAPGFYTGYGAKTLPGIREGIEQKQYAEAESEVTRAAHALESYANTIDEAAKELEQLNQ